jgi:hypothetical protein
MNTGFNAHNRGQCFDYGNFFAKKGNFETGCSNILKNKNADSSITMA